MLESNLFLLRLMIMGFSMLHAAKHLEKKYNGDLSDIQTFPTCESDLRYRSRGRSSLAMVEKYSDCFRVFHRLKLVHTS